MCHFSGARNAKTHLRKILKLRSVLFYGFLTCLTCQGVQECLHTGISGVLVQTDHLIVYFSHRLTDADSCYTTTELKLLTVVNSSTHLNVSSMCSFLFKIYYMALKWFEICESNNSLLWWSQCLSQHITDIQHHPATRLWHFDDISWLQDKKIVIYCKC